MKKSPVIALTWASSLALAGCWLLAGRAFDLALGTDTAPTSALVAALPAALLSGAAACAALTVAGRALVRAEPEMRQGLVRHLLDLGPAERTRERAGRIVNTATDGVERSATYKATFVAQTIASLATPLLVVLVIGVAIDPVAAALLAISVPVVPLVIGGFQRVVGPVSKRYRTASRALAAKELDAIQGLSTLALLGAGERMGRTLAQASEDVRRRVMSYLAGNQIVLLVVDSVFSLGMTTGAVALALWRIDAGAITPGEGLSLLLLSAIMLDPLDRIGQFFYIGMGGMAATREIARIHAEEPEVSDSAEATVPQEVPAPGTIDLVDLHFGYEADHPVLDGVDLHVDRGEHLALTGASGAGKSTLSSLLQVMRRPDAGHLLVEGVDTATAPASWVRSRLGVVEQSTYLFSTSLRDNLLLAEPDATDADLLAALRAAHLDDLLERLPEGLDTRIGDRGLSLSGGEAQRVAIARALLTNAPILLLDEPTAHVDLISEQEILHALDEIGRERTTLTISHRSATIAHADRRVELTEGRLK